MCSTYLPLVKGLELNALVFSLFVARKSVDCSLCFCVDFLHKHAEICWLNWQKEKLNFERPTWGTAFLSYKEQPWRWLFTVNIAEYLMGIFVLQMNCILLSVKSDFWVLWAVWDSTDNRGCSSHWLAKSVKASVNYCSTNIWTHPSMHLTFMPFPPRHPFPHTTLATTQKFWLSSANGRIMRPNIVLHETKKKHFFSLIILLKEKVLSIH